MEAGKSRSFQRPRAGRWLPLLLILLAGCASSRARLERALVQRQPTARSHTANTAYTVACPDVLELRVPAHPELSGRREIGPDGRIDLGALGRLHAEGLPPSEIAYRISQVVEVPCVRVDVADYNSRQVFVTGQVVGLQRAVAYGGPETVLDLLQRAGGITPGAAPDNVYVVRPHLGENRQPEVFRVDLKAIVLKQESRTNIYLQPLDEVFVGETRRCTYEKCVPPWLRPLYERFWGMWRKDGKTTDEKAIRNGTSTPGLQR